MNTFTMKKLVVFVYTLVSFISYSQSVLITDATIVDVEKGTLLERQTILVKKGKIEQISSNKIKNKDNLKAVSYTHLTLPTTPYV